MQKRMKTMMRLRLPKLITPLILLFAMRVFCFAAAEFVSVNARGESSGFSTSQRPAVSASGRFVAFDSSSSDLVGNDQLDRNDIFLRDRLTGLTVRVSGGIGDDEANGDSFDSAISGDGHFVAFSSEASNLVPGDTNNERDIFVYDRQTRKTVRASVGTGGAQAEGSSFFPAISGNGRFVGFISSASNLVAGDTNGRDDVFVRDLVAGTTKRVSVRSDGAQLMTAPGFSGPPNFTYDGNRVVFTATSTDLVGGDTNGDTPDVFLHDQKAKTTVIASLTSAGAQTNAFAGDGQISGDGNVLAFTSPATNLPGGNGQLHVFVRDLRTGSVTKARTAATYSYGPRLSADGRRVALISAVGAASEQVEVVDRATGEVFAPARFQNGSDAGNSSAATLSADGRVAGFSTGAGIVGNDSNHATDVYARPLFDTIGFAKTAQYVLESDPTVSMVVRREGVLNGAVSVRYAVIAAGDTAVDGRDFSVALKTGTLSWAVGDATDRTLTVPLINTPEGDGYRFFTVALTAPTGGAVLGTATTKIVIRDTETDPVENHVGHRLKIESIVSLGTNWDTGTFRALFTIRNPAPLPSFPGFIEFSFNDNVIANANFDSVPANGTLVVDAVANVGQFPDGDLFARLFETTDDGAVLQDGGFAAGFINNGTAPPSGGTSNPDVNLKPSGPPPVTIKSITIEGSAMVNEGTFADYTVKVTLSDNVQLTNITPTWRSTLFTINGAGRFTVGDVAADKLATLTATVFRNGVSTSAARAITVKNVPATPVITSPATAFATRGKPFNYKITARHEPTGFGATNLPAGLGVNPTTGLISGTPTVAGVVAVQIQATNGSGTDTNPLTLTVSEPSPLTVNIVGTGTVAPDLNGDILDVGRTYKLLAKPGVNQIFAGWSGGATSLPPALAFVMTPNLSLTANFIPNPFLTRSGKHAAIISSTPVSHAAGGLFQALVSKTGGCSGKLTLGGKAHGFKTTLQADGTSPAITLPRPGGGSVTFTLALDVVGTTGTMNGALTSGPLRASFTARSAAADAALAGRYTVVLPGPITPDPLGTTPDGSGFGTIIVTAKGVVKFTGVLGDGTPVAQSGVITIGGFWPCYAPAYGGKGSIAGRVTFAALASHDLSAQLAWFKPARATDPFYPAGWPAGIVSSFLGARYTAPPVLPALGSTGADGNAMLTANGGGLLGAVSQTVNLADNGSVTLVPPALPKFRATTTAATGLFGGTFRDPISGSVRKFSGAVQQKLGIGQGFFRGSDRRTGSVLLESNAP